MNKERFEYIITRYLRGIASSEEEKELLSAIHSSDELYAAFRERTSGYQGEEDDREMDRKWNRIASIIIPSEETKEGKAPISLPSASKRTMWFSIAAAIILLCVSGATAFFIKQTDTYNLEKNTEWLTVAAELDDRTCVLPDGTSVYLRKGAVLSYPGTFVASTRNVSIQGEAFFEVTPDPEKPFIVNTSNLFVKVLGTSFSVQALDKTEIISVTLVEGSVSLNNTDQKELFRLMPNQKAEYFVNNGQCKISEVDSERLTSWRKGILSYDNASIDEIVRLIEQTYNVSLQYAKPENDTQRFSGAFLKTQKLETVLELTSKLTGTELRPG